MKNNIWIIIPCYNEGDILPHIYPRFVQELRSMKQAGLAGEGSILLFVDDGSQDDTWDIISSINNRYKDVHGLKLEQNVGQQCAMMAGLMVAKEYSADAAITIDCDGQDDIHAMTQMVQLFHKGNEIVYGVRNDRSSDTILKRVTAIMYYKTIHLFDKTMVYNHSEFRLMSNYVLQYLDAHGERNLFIRKICSTLDYRKLYPTISSACVYYKREVREAGKTHYSFFQLCKLALRSLKPVAIHIGHTSHNNQYIVEQCTYLNDLKEDKI